MFEVGKEDEIIDSWDSKSSKIVDGWNANDNNNGQNYGDLALIFNYQSRKNSYLLYESVKKQTEHLPYICVQPIPSKYVTSKKVPKWDH